MTTEEWEKVRKAVEGFYPPTILKIDGYDVSLRMVRIGAYRNAIVLYVGGVFEGKWLAEDCEERRRFCQKKVRSLLTPKGRTYLKRLSKKRQKEFTEKYHTEYESYSPYWTSFGALKRHLIANNQSIELVKIN